MPTIPLPPSTGVLTIVPSAHPWGRGGRKGRTVGGRERGVIGGREGWRVGEGSKEGGGRGKERVRKEG